MGMSGAHEWWSSMDMCEGWWLLHSSSLGILTCVCTLETVYFVQSLPLNFRIRFCSSWLNEKVLKTLMLNPFQEIIINKPLNRILNCALPCKDHTPYFIPDQIAPLVLFWNKFSLLLQLSAKNQRRSTVFWCHNHHSGCWIKARISLLEGSGSLPWVWYSEFP
jgi:hypothetical protein